MKGTASRIFLNSLPDIAFRTAKIPVIDRLNVAKNAQRLGIAAVYFHRFQRSRSGFRESFSRLEESHSPQAAISLGDPGISLGIVRILFQGFFKVLDGFSFPPPHSQGILAIQIEVVGL